MEGFTRGLPGLMAAIMFASESGGGSDDFADSFADRAPAFLFKNAGDKVVGTVVDITTGYDRKYQQSGYPILIIDDEISGERVSVHCFHAALISQLERCNPHAGERIGIQYMGERESGGGFSYKDFVAKVDRSTSERSASFRAVASETVRDEAREAVPESEDTEGDDLPF